MTSLKVRVYANSHFEKIEALGLDQYKVWLTAPPEKNKANQRLIKILAKYFQVSKRALIIKKGLKTKNKVIEIIVNGADYGKNK